ncbi:probable pectinesterase/pectinesterase inhibitor 51 [Typha angustifolia]|uniref:probable pectinesterase/pectinesterase inhibitor 51 n=1 Tax=Typha angustifolia TaxID=59011 RepID=UPI003C2D5DA8
MRKATTLPTTLLLLRRRPTLLLFLLFCTFLLSLILLLPSSPSPNSHHLILSSLSAASAAITKSASIIPSSSAAAPNCIAHLSLSSRRLAAASAAATRLRLLDARHFAGAALQYQYDCSNALSHLKSTPPIAAALSSLASLSSLTSVSLALISALLRFGPDHPVLQSPPQTERDGFWEKVATARPSADSDLVAAFPPHLSPNLTVCKIGSCDFRAIQDAIFAAPNYGLSHFVIYIKAGVYQENVVIPFEKTGIVFLGAGPGATVITAARHAQMPGLTTFDTPTVAVLGDGFRAKGITFENAAGAGAHQAVAFRSDSDRSFLESVEFRGHQDTLYARSMRQLYRDCRISGTVDFVFGNAAAVFERCILEVVPRLENPEKGERNAITAHGRIDPGQATGFVFRNCSVTGSAEYLALYQKKPAVHRVYLGRPWKMYARTVLVGCYLGEVVRPEGWLPWRGEFALRTLFYGEYGSRGPGANATARVEWSSQIPEEHLPKYSVENFIQGDEWAAF